MNLKNLLLVLGGFPVTSKTDPKTQVQPCQLITLEKDIENYKAAFLEYDEDGSGNISTEGDVRSPIHFFLLTHFS